MGRGVSPENKTTQNWKSQNIGQSFSGHLLGGGDDELVDGHVVVLDPQEEVQSAQVGLASRLVFKAQRKSIQTTLGSNISFIQR